MACMRTPLVVLALASFACHAARGETEGSGVARTEPRTVGDFTGVAAAGAVRLAVSVGGATSVAVTADDNVVPLIRTRVVDGQLSIDAVRRYAPKTPVTITITTPSLTALAISGATTAEARGVSGARLAVVLSGASKAVLAGSASSLELAASGDSSLDAAGLAADEARVVVSGSSAVTVAAARALSVVASGDSTVEYLGKPTLSQNVSGTSRVRPR